MWILAGMLTGILFCIVVIMSLMVAAKRGDLICEGFSRDEWLFKGRLN